MRVSVVMPVYNECRMIEESLRRVLERPEPDEILVVDDGSTDGTRAILDRLIASRPAGRPSIRLILQDGNEGKGSALRAGFAASTGDIVIIQDADLEYDPRDYPVILGPIVDGEADAVFGSRFLGGGRHRVLLFWHFVANKILTMLVNAVSNLNLTDVWTGYKVFRGDLIRALPLSSDRFGFEPEVTIKLARLGVPIYEVPVSYRGRGYAEGKKIGWRDGLASLGTIARTCLFPNLGAARVLTRGARASGDRTRASPGS
jgi:glycosyltransferase involved in cell wall biosynthesis